MNAKVHHLQISFLILLMSICAPPAWGEMVWTEEPGGRTAVIRMSVTPAPESTPAFRHRIVQQPIDLVAGNAAPYYYRAHLQLPRTNRQLQQRFGETWEDWYDNRMPLGQMPLAEVREAARSIDYFVETYLVAATSRRDCDWEWNVEDIRGPELISFFLEEAQEARGIARVLALAARLAVAEGRYDDAVRYLRINYRVGRDVAQPPFLVCTLIGTAVVGLGNTLLLDLMAAPDSPNMYWALSELPRPPIDYQRAFQFELEIGERIFPFLHDPETTERSADEWARLWRQAWDDLGKLDNDVKPVGPLISTAAALAGYTHAKERLIDDGLDREHVHAMPVGQVMAVYSARAYARITGEYRKQLTVPIWRSPEFDADHAIRDAHPLGSGEWREIVPIASFLLPAVAHARKAEMRLQRDIDAMRVIEALRMYAASTAGQLPERLDDVHQVPVPLNPATGQSFLYRLEGDTAILELPEADGLLNAGRRFEITINQPEF